ncbi:triggering receptor expressed on myeloid cells 1-like [Notamacropus eugenii]|uniref:triggering receptor expressed on myeloid cells 1-like n=1 Tax=Notamacropus eugenii TaxID=9315 RepID=UPI003B67854A
MMAKAAPLLLLLPLLLMGSQGQENHVKYQEGQTLEVSCSYKPQRGENRWKTWCKVREDEEVCERLITRSLGYTGQHRDPRASLEDNTKSGTITITMSNLRVKDSGTYCCGIYNSYWKTIDIIRTIVVDVSPAKTFKTTKSPRPITEKPLTTTPSQATTETPLITSATTLVTRSPRNNQKFIIWGSVLVSLLLVGLLSAGIVYAVKISRKPGTGDHDFHHVYEDFEELEKKAREVTMEMQEESSEVIQYASVIHATQHVLEDSIYANTQMGPNPGSTPIPNEPVEYATITRTGPQLPK